MLRGSVQRLAGSRGPGAACMTDIMRKVMGLAKPLACDSASTLKWRSRRLVTKVLPPPGGPMAATSCTSVSCLKALSRPYQPPWSTAWRSSSMGGCAPYVSLAGMLRSSTNSTPLRRCRYRCEVVPCGRKSHAQ